MNTENRASCLVEGSLTFGVAVTAALIYGEHSEVLPWLVGGAVVLLVIRELAKGTQHNK